YRSSLYRQVIYPAIDRGGRVWRWCSERRRGGGGRRSEGQPSPSGSVGDGPARSSPPWASSPTPTMPIGVSPSWGHTRNVVRAVRSERARASARAGEGPTEEGPDV